MLGKKRSELQTAGIKLSFVHMGTEQEAAPYFQRYGLTDTPHFSDPKKKLYKAFGLQRAGFLQLFKPTALVHGFKTAILKGLGAGIPRQDEYQMPGVFLIHKGKVVRSHHYKEPWDHPDFDSFAGGLV